METHELWAALEATLKRREKLMGTFLDSSAPHDGNVDIPADLRDALVDLVAFPDLIAQATYHDAFRELGELATQDRDFREGWNALNAKVETAEARRNLERQRRDAARAHHLAEDAEEADKRLREHEAELRKLYAERNDATKARHATFRAFSERYGSHTERSNAPGFEGNPRVEWQNSAWRTSVAQRAAAVAKEKAATKIAATVQDASLVH